MKKLYHLMLILSIVFSLLACNNSNTNPIDGLSPYNMIFSYMGTETQITIFLEDLEEGSVHREQIDAIYGKYHELSDYLRPLHSTSTYKENIYTINQKPEEDIEIDEPLYHLIAQAEAYRILTNGYFDISVGTIVSAWKELTETYLLEVIPEEEFNKTIAQIEELGHIEDAIELWMDNESFFIRIKEGVNLDPGAITKGYATEFVKDYLFEQEIEYFSISGGSSSISLGKNYNRETGLFHIALQNPVRTGIDDRTYGMIYLNQTGVTTSGNYVQYALYNNLRYHHIVSPFSKMPMHYYHTVTVIGANLGLMDAVSTALFNMDPETFKTWLEQNQEDLNIEVIRFNYDRTITTFLKETVFEER